MLRERKSRVLVVWGRNDPSFIAAGADAFKRDLRDAEIHLLESQLFCPGRGERRHRGVSFSLSWPNVSPDCSGAALERSRGCDHKSKANSTGS
jgi:hypothetical protein